MNYNDYHEDWKDIIRPAVLKRDNYKCRNCHIPNKQRVYKDSKGNYVYVDDFIEQWAKAQGIKVFKIYLHIAHLDQNKSNNHMSNLLTLCPRCHSSYDKSSKAIRKIKYKNDNKRDEPQINEIEMFLRLCAAGTLTKQEIKRNAQQILNK